MQALLSQTEHDAWTGSPAGVGWVLQPTNATISVRRPMPTSHQTLLFKLQSFYDPIQSAEISSPRTAKSRATLGQAVGNEALQWCRPAHQMLPPMTPCPVAQTPPTDLRYQVSGTSNSTRSCVTFGIIAPVPAEPAHTPPSSAACETDSTSPC